MLDMGTCIEAFLENLKLKNYARATIMNKRYCLYYFKLWAEENNLTLEKITPQDMDSFAALAYTLKRRNGRPLSIDRKSEYIRSMIDFFKFLLLKNLVLRNPTLHIEIPRRPKLVPRDVLTPLEVRRILARIDVSTKFGMRAKAMLEILYSTGIRNSELCKLQVADINFEKEIVVIRQGKGRKDRVVPIGSVALKWVERYLKSARLAFPGAAASSYLFIGQYGKPYVNNAMTALIRRYVMGAGITKKGSCHLFRHSMATHMLKNGCDIRYIQELLGHVELTTTQIYTRVEISDLKKVYQRTA